MNGPRVHEGDIRILTEVIPRPGDHLARSLAVLSEKPCEWAAKRLRGCPLSMMHTGRPLWAICIAPDTAPLSCESLLAASGRMSPCMET